MEKRIGKLWYYDRALNYRVQDLETALHETKKVNRQLKEGGRDILTQILIADEMKGTPIGDEFMKPLNSLASLINAAEQRINSSKVLLKNLRKAMPILIGPATLDTLVNHTPTTYDYVSNEQLPFKNMFFEFYEPLKLGIPFEQKRKEVVGIHFYTTSILDAEGLTDDLKYIAEIFYLNSNGKIRSMIISCNPETKASFRGSMRNANFYIDMNLRTVKYSYVEDLKKELVKGNVVVGTEEYLSFASLDDIENSDFFVKVANLCTNIINYINARNKTIIKKKREVEIKTDNADGGKKRKRTVRREEPYSIIKINPVKYEGERTPTGMHWTLKEKVYVIGHHRTYRDENGDPRLVIFIDPFVKGPEDAPWKDQRYKLMYEALLREKRMLETGKRFN